MKKYIFFSLLVLLLMLVTGCSFEFGTFPEDGPAKESPPEKKELAETKEKETTMAGNDLVDADTDVATDTGAGTHEAQAQMNRFESDELGFAVGYPTDWIYEKQGENIIVFSGPEGTESYHTTVNMQNIRWGEAYSDFEDFYLDYKEQLQGAGGEITELTQVDYEQNGDKYDSVGFTGRYVLDGEDFGQWIIAIDRGDGVFHQFSYTAPVDLFEEYQETAIVMLDYFEILH